MAAIKTNSVRTTSAKPGPPAEEPRIDGRSARRDANKVAVVDAFLDLIREGVARPSVAEVAERSGVSHRSVFRYFADRDEMARTSIERQQARVRPLLETKVDMKQSLADRVTQLVDLRIQLFDVVAPTARLSRALAPTQPILQDELTATRAALRAGVKRVFAPELAKLKADDAADALAAIDVLTSFESIDLLRTDRGLSRPKAARALRRSIHALL